MLLCGTIRKFYAAARDAEKSNGDLRDIEEELNKEKQLPPCGLFFACVLIAVRTRLFRRAHSAFSMRFDLQLHGWLVAFEAASVCLDKAVGVRR